jgi:signal peptidase II
LKRPWALGAILFVSTLILDASTKVWAEAALADGPIHLGFDWLALRLAYNHGVAFSFLDGMPHWILGVGALVLLAAVLWSLRPIGKTRLGAAAMGLVAAGGIANATDRLLDGRVTDMISVGIWPIFNVADIAISVGVGLIILGSRKGASRAQADAGDEDLGEVNASRVR